MSNVVDLLVEMGFNRNRAEVAVSRTGDQDVQVAMDWLLSHEEELDAPELQDPEPVAAAASNEPQLVADSGATNSEDQPSTPQEKVPVARSIHCDDCGKLFDTNEEVEFHAAKSGHANFSESTEEKKPLSEEEKKEQLAKIEAKLKQRRLEREAREKEEALLKEKNRIKSGKEMLEAKKRHEELEMKKIVEQRKREKEEEKLAKQRVRDQIEQDKLARKAKFGGVPLEVPAVSLVAPAPTKSKSTTVHSEVRLQIRLPNGTALTETFKAKEPLSAVRLFIELRHDSQEPFTLMTNFPKKIFVPDDYDKPLDSLGLAPTATLIVSKS